MSSANVIHVRRWLRLQLLVSQLLVELLRGVVQGSGIVPVLFLIYIDDLAKWLESHGNLPLNCLQTMLKSILKSAG